MLAGEMYDSMDPELYKLRQNAKKVFREYNTTFNEDGSYKIELLKNIFGKTGNKVNIEPDIKFDYGFNIYVGENFYANYNCIFLDVCKIEIGDNCMIAPNVAIYTATHPLNPIERNSGLEYGKPIKIGNNVWIGGNAIICPGVTLGDNIVVAAGAVVTKNFPDNVLIGGNPAKIIKFIK
jgi:maltose O-acetyltransferase